MQKSEFQIHLTYRVSQSRSNQPVRGQVRVDRRYPNLSSNEHLRARGRRHFTLTSTPGNSFCTRFKPSWEARTHSSLILFTENAIFVTPRQEPGCRTELTRYTPLQNHVQRRACRTSCGDKGVEQEHLVHIWVWRKLSIVCFRTCTTISVRSKMTTARRPHTFDRLQGHLLPEDSEVVHACRTARCAHIVSAERD